MSSSSVISKKLKFKGDKPKKKRRHHHDADEGAADELEALAAADPSGWMFPTDPMHISGPAFILLPLEKSEDLFCLAWDAQRQRVFAVPLSRPQAPEGANDLTDEEVIASIEPGEVNHVWVVTRLSGSEGVVSLRTSSGTFLTANPSGTLTADTPSRGPLESFTPVLAPPSAPSETAPSSSFPSFHLQTPSGKYLTFQPGRLGSGSKPELRADADGPGPAGRLRVKCQREFVLKARREQEEREAGPLGVGVSSVGSGMGKRREREDGAGPAGSREDEARRNREMQAWGGGRSIVSEADRREIKRAKKEGRLAEAMLDRRAALKSDRYAK